MCQAARQWVASSLAAARRSAVAALPFPLSGACQPRARSAASETNERTNSRTAEWKDERPANVGRTRSEEEKFNLTLLDCVRHHLAAAAVAAEAAARAGAKNGARE